MDARSSDANLLFGVLALQMDFITRDQLIKTPSLLQDIATTKLSTEPEDPGYDLYLRLRETARRLMR